MANLRKIGFRNVKPLELAVLQASEDADDALRIMANVRAYFQGNVTGFLLVATQESFPALTFGSITSRLQTLCRQHRQSD
jgi:hypothetical protein